MRKTCLAVVVLAACGNGDEGIEISTRDATAAECSGGGTVLTVNGLEHAVCNGAPGTDGENGVDGTDGADGVDGRDGTNGTDGADGAAQKLILETVFCEANSVTPFRNVTYKHARFYDGAVFISVSCDTAADQDASSDIFSADQAGAVTGVMRCLLTDETNPSLDIVFTPNFLARTLQITEEGAVASNQNFDTDCVVVNN